MAMRSFRPGTDNLAGLADRICILEDALNLLEATSDAARTLEDSSKVAHVRQRALDAAQRVATLKGRLLATYQRGQTIRIEEARRVADMVGSVDHTVKYEAGALGTLAIYSEVEPFYRAVGLFLGREVCKRPSRFKWWLIPLVLVGTTLVVYSETKKTNR
jgi:hypothetical protein